MWSRSNTGPGISPQLYILEDVDKVIESRGDILSGFFRVGSSVRDLTTCEPLHKVDKMTYLVLKWVHILSAVFLFGAGAGSAFYVWRANRTGNLHAIRFVLRNVILADWLFTVPPIALLPVTGVWMMRLQGHAFSDLWIWLSLMLFVIAGLCWVPAAFLQYKMKTLAGDALDKERLPATYWKYERLWFVLGVAAFPAVIAIFTLMIFKPVG